MHEPVLHVGRGPRAAEEVVQQLGDTQQPTAVVPQVDDVIADAKGAELIEGGRELRIGGADVGAQVQVSDAGRAGLRQHLRAESVRDRVDGHRALHQRDVARDAIAQQAQATPDPRVGWAEHVTDRRAIDEQLADRDEAAP